MKNLMVMCLVGMGVLGVAVSSQAQYILVSENLGTEHYTASSVYIDWPWMTPNWAFDGSFDWDATHMVWLSADAAPQWIEVDLGQPAQLAKVVLCLEQYPDGNTTQEIYVSNSPMGSDRTGATLVHTFSGYSVVGDIREVVLPSPVWARYAQVYCSEWPNNPALREVQFFALPPAEVAVEGTVVPVGYVGDNTSVYVKVHFESLEGAGSVTRGVVLRDDSTFRLEDIPVGIYRVTVGGDAWLRTVKDSVTVAVDSTDLGSFELRGGDGNGDGQVSFEDFSILQNNYGQEDQSAGPLAAAATGGCGALGLALMMILGLALRCGE